MKKILLAAIITLLFLPSGLLAMSRTGPVHISHPAVHDATADVEVKGQGRSEWEPVERGTLLFSGDTIRTGPEGRAIIRFASGTIRMDENSEISVPTTGEQERRKDVRDVDVIQGSVLLDVSVTEGEGSFTFGTAETMGLTEKSILTVSFLEKGTAVNVYTGDVQVSYGKDQGEMTVGLIPGSSLRVEEMGGVDRIVRFDPQPVLESYFDNIPPGLDEESGLPVPTGSAEDGLEEKRPAYDDPDDRSDLSRDSVKTDRGISDKK